MKTGEEKAAIVNEVSLMLYCAKILKHSKTEFYSQLKIRTKDFKLPDSSLEYLTKWLEGQYTFDSYYRHIRLYVLNKIFSQL